MVPRESERSAYLAALPRKSTAPGRMALELGLQD
jgi:hypothetical protein